MSAAPDSAAEPIARSVFDGLNEYSTALGGGKIPLNKPLTDTTAVIIFCQSFFVQFFDNVVGAPIEGIDQQAKEECVSARQTMPTDDRRRPLLALFEELCDEWPEVLGMMSGFLRDDLLDFHIKYMPALLDGIAAWAATLNNAPLHGAAAAARKEYQQGLAMLRKARKKP